MNIFIRELKANRKALIIWSVCMFLFVLSGMSKYTAYSGSGVNSDIFTKMPKALKALLGIGPFDVTSMSGFYSFLFPYLELTAAIHALLLGNSMIAKEERDKTTEFLIAKPVSRTAVVTSKLLAALVNVIILNLVSLFSSLAIVPGFNKGKDITPEILAFDLSMFIVQIIFLSLGAFIAAFMRKPKASGSIGTGILLGGYMIARLTDFTDRLNALNILSPFKYFSYVRIVNGDGLNALIVILSLIPAALFAVSTYYFYLRRDLNI